jgi:hypothetical protein
MKQFAILILLFLTNYHFGCAQVNSDFKKISTEKLKSIEYVKQGITQNFDSIGQLRHIKICYKNCAEYRKEVWFDSLGNVKQFIWFSKYQRDHWDTLEITRNTYDGRVLLKQFRIIIDDGAFLKDIFIVDSMIYEIKLYGDTTIETFFESKYRKIGEGEMHLYPGRGASRIEFKRENITLKKNKIAMRQIRIDNYLDSNLEFSQIYRINFRGKIKNITFYNEYDGSKENTYRFCRTMTDGSVYTFTKKKGGGFRMRYQIHYKLFQKKNVFRIEKDMNEFLPMINLPFKSARKYIKEEEQINFTYY